LWAQVFDPSQPLPANLPVPVDDGAGKHLPGMAVPKIKLRSTRDRWVDLSAVSAPRVVVYCYHAAEVIEWLRHHPSRGS